MKTIIGLILTTKLFVIANITLAAGIVGSKHDFSNQIWSRGEVCIACHTPHGSNSTVEAPLWDHTLTTQTYTPYTSDTMKATAGQPDGLSKLCLSCHDGTIAIDSFNKTMGSTMIANPIGPNLQNGQGHWKHPVSFIYDSNLAVADTRIYDPSVVVSPLGGTIQRDLLKNNKVQCTSCHDVHNSKGLDKLLKINETDLCITCHNN